LFTNVPLSTNIIFRPGLNFTQKGGKITSGSSQEVKIIFNYLEVPLDFIYKATGGLFIGAGPSLAYALSGKAKYSGFTPAISDDKVKIGNDANNDELKAFEFGGNILAGYAMSSGLSFSINYNLGLSNLNPTTDKDEDFKNRYLGIRLGYTFGNPKSMKKNN
jgi:glycine cleavage system aminomethyltransferase T